MDGASIMRRLIIEKRYVNTWDITGVSLVWNNKQVTN